MSCASASMVGQLPWRTFLVGDSARTDLGVDLKAPLHDAGGGEKWTYALIREVTPGDVILHWSTPRRAVVGWSVAEGEWWEEEIVWVAHGSSAHASGAAPFARPGLRRALTSFSVRQACVNTLDTPGRGDAAERGYGLPEARGPQERIGGYTRFILNESHALRSRGPTEPPVLTSSSRSLEGPGQ
jgi:hypothetical protein